VQDVPGLKHSYDPVLDIYPKWAESGTYHVSFDIMAQPGADWFFEMRNKGGEFAAGPYLRWQKGTLVANNTASQKARRRETRRMAPHRPHRHHRSREV
jgi:hypothetical protein